MIDPDKIIAVPGSGTGDIASVLRHPFGVPAAVVQLLLHFDSGTLSADLTLSKDSWRGSLFDATLLTVTNVGAGGVDVNLQVPTTDLQFWMLTEAQDGGETDGLRLAWTDPGTSVWSYELLLIALDDFPNG